MQLMSPEDLTLDDALDSVNGGWNYYVDSYVLEQPTEGIGSEIHAPLLHR
jgi:histone deacetylase complex regulatory component SIN3